MTEQQRNALKALHEARIKELLFSNHFGSKELLAKAQLASILAALDVAQHPSIIDIASGFVIDATPIRGWDDRGFCECFIRTLEYHPISYSDVVASAVVDDLTKAGLEAFFCHDDAIIGIVLG